ncbi:MAG: DNRLRE domain-containing protein [Prochloron sp. SP5CPC1]|nr:DNRLRE domain-containing protein [Candidatus Paraprochloron terpiosi SP5CPC1]
MKRSLLAVLTVLFCLTTAVIAVSAKETQVLQASKDTTLIESPTGDLSNGVGPAFFVGRTNQSTGSLRRGLLAFDIAEQIPPCSQVQSVQLTLTVERAAGVQAIGLHRVLKHWSEGNSSSEGGKGSPATKGDTTWIHTFYDSDFWTNPGGDFSTLVSAVQKVGNKGTYTWDSTPEMVADVQQWLDSPRENFGWLLLGNEEVPKTAKRFASHENPDVLAQPQLRVSFKENSC